METVALERLGRFERGYENTPVDPTYLAIYRREEILPNAFAFIHAGLAAEFKWVNVKARGGLGGHFNADNSRNLSTPSTAFEKFGPRSIRRAWGWL